VEKKVILSAAATAAAAAIICTHSIVSPFSNLASERRKERGKVYNCYLLAFKNLEYSPP
jgi:hypothetical protein